MRFRQSILMILIFGILPILSCTNPIIEEIYTRDKGQNKPPKGTEIITVSGVSLNLSTPTLPIGETETLTAVIEPENATNRTITWTSSDDLIAAVSDGGLVTALAEGTATITVTTLDGGHTASCEVTVEAVAPDTIAVTGVSLNLTTLTMVVSETETLTAAVQPENATNRTIIWSTSDNTVATVDGGLVTALAEGSATITVTTVDGEHTASCTVTVKERTGEADAPFLIKNELELRKVGTGTDGWILSAHYKLAVDITVNGEWMPIGDYSNNTANRFTGSFNGNNKTITGLIINKPSANYQGMFGFIGAGGEVINLTLVDCNICGKDYVGGLLGRNAGTVKNCNVSGDFRGTSQIGGVAGRNAGTITDCGTEGFVNGTGNYIGGVAGVNDASATMGNCYATGMVCGGSYVGGVAGFNYGTVKNSHATGDVKGNNSTSTNAGGVVGVNYDNATVKNCYATGNVMSEGNVYGGVAGSNSGLIANCYSTGDVSGDKTYAGGVAGSNPGTVENCYATGNVRGNDCVGGVVGGNANSVGTVINCYATSNVSGNGQIGGVVGSNTNITRNCYATGDISGNGQVGGVVGISYGTSTVENCYATGDISGTSSVGGVVGISYGTVENCVALNPNINSQSPYRRIGYVSGTMANNYGRKDMKRNNSAIIWTNDIHGVDGADITTADYQLQSWWSSCAGFDFGATWEWDNASQLPVLYSVSN